jgi:hypothetical protein
MAADDADGADVRTTRMKTSMATEGPEDTEFKGTRSENIKMYFSVCMNSVISVAVAN